MELTDLVTLLTPSEMRSLIRRLINSSDRTWDAYVAGNRADKGLMETGCEAHNLAMFLYRQTGR
jgi:hypothetical protein